MMTFILLRIFKFSVKYHSIKWYRLAFDIQVLQSAMYNMFNFCKCPIPSGRRQSQLSTASFSSFSINCYNFLGKIIEWIFVAFYRLLYSVLVFQFNSHTMLMSPVYFAIQSIAAKVGEMKWLPAFSKDINTDYKRKRFYESFMECILYSVK